MINFLTLKENLKNNQYPALCLCGSDRWLQRKSIANICEVYGISDDGFGVDRLEAPTYQEVVMACCTPSMFCEKKLVVCEDFVFPQGKQQAETVSKFSELIANCDGTFCLIFVSQAPTIFDKISGLEFVNCDKLDGTSVVKWIVAFCKRQGVEIDNQCARKISDYCLQDMSRVSSETQKLIDFGQITPESIELLVHKDSEYVVFNLSKTISDKNATAAIELYKGLVASGEEPRALFQLLYNFYRRAYYVKTSEFSTDQLAAFLGVKPFAVERAKEIAAKYRAIQLKKILDCFSTADIKLKAFLDETEVMVSLIMQIVAL